MKEPPEFIQWAAYHPKEWQAYQKHPLAYFGNVVKYPKQATIIRTWFELQPKVTVITGWKRCSKTCIAAYITCCWMLGMCKKDWPGARSMGIDKDYVWPSKQEKMALIGGKSLDHVENVLLDIYRQLLPSGTVKKWFTRNNHVIQMYDFSKFVVRSYDQDLEAWKSGAYKMLHLDEEPPEDVLKECLSRTSTEEGKIIISVAVDDADASYLPEACKNPRKFFGTDSFLHFKLGTEDVPDAIIPPEEKIIIYNQYDGTPFEAAARKGEFAYVSGRWWPEFDPRVHVIPAFNIPPDWKRFRFMDAGTAAPASCIWVAMHPSNIMFVYREYYKKGTTIDERCHDVIQLSNNKRQREGSMFIEQHISEDYEFTQLDYHEFKRDDHTGDSLDFEYIKAGLLVTPSTTLHQEARREMARKWLYVDKTKNHFITHEKGAPKIYIFDTCANLIWEAQKKAFKKPTSDRSPASERKVQNKDDHAMDCVEYACTELSWCIEQETDEYA